MDRTLFKECPKFSIQLTASREYHPQCHQLISRLHYVPSRSVQRCSAENATGLCEGYKRARHGKVRRRAWGTICVFRKNMLKF